MDENEKALLLGYQQLYQQLKNDYSNLLSVINRVKAGEGRIEDFTVNADGSWKMEFPTPLEIPANPDGSSNGEPVNRIAEF